MRRTVLAGRAEELMASLSGIVQVGAGPGKTAGMPGLASGMKILDFTRVLSGPTFDMAWMAGQWNA